MSLVAAVEAHPGARSRRAGRDARPRVPASPQRRRRRAAALLGPLDARPRRPASSASTPPRGGAGPSPGAVARALARLDDERIRGDARARRRAERAASRRAERGRARGASPRRGTRARRRCPPDWSDIYGEIELTSSDHLDPAALALAPVNPARYGATPGFRFRCARQFGYGASPGDGAALPRAARRARHPRRGAASSASSPTRSRSARRGRSGTSAARSSSGRRPTAERVYPRATR